MTLPQLHKKVKESGPTRAYLTTGRIEHDDLFYRGQRGTLIFEGGDYLYFYSDADSRIPFEIEFANEVHAPSAGHYTWG